MELKLCKDCDHSQNLVGLFYCHHPSNEPDLVRGGVKEVFCSDMRKGVCGTEAKLFRPKDERPKPRSTFFSSMNQFLGGPWK